MTSRSVLLVVHTGRRQAIAAARDIADRLAATGLGVRVLEPEADALGIAAVERVPTNDAAAANTELVVALGGDGTLLRAAELARPACAPLLGINMGRVGFLAEADRNDLETIVAQIVSSSYDVEERLTLDVAVRRRHDVVETSWALNDVTVEKAARQRMLELVVEVDGRPLSRWPGDGVVCATPTGSTAYAFSAGGPIVWPAVQAMLVVPISAHALFARPIVVAPDSGIAVELMTGDEAIAFCDGRRTIHLKPHDRVEIRQGVLPVRLVRLAPTPFTDRLVGKFHLPVRGWRGPIEDDTAPE